MNEMKLNITAYRILYILQVLVQYRALSLQELNEHLFHNPNIGKSFNAETLSKYINTLRKAGCQLPKARSRTGFSYELTCNPFPIQLEADALEAARRALQVLESHPDGDHLDCFGRFLDQVEWMMGQNPEVSVFAQSDTPPPPERARLEKFRQHCKDEQTLEIRLIEGKTFHLDPLRVEQQGSRCYLFGMETTRHAPMKLDLEKIAFTRQLPTKARRKPNLMLVKFELYDRLAMSYRLYPGEQILSRTADRICVQTKTDDPALLLRRLRKYGPLCQILSPESLREEMRTSLIRLQAILEASSDASSASLASRE